MFRKELLLLGTIAGAILLTVVSVSWFAARSLQKHSTLLVKDTLPGLMDAGMAIGRMQNNWFALQKMLADTNSVALSNTVEYVRNNSTEGLWIDYGKSIYSEEDRRGYEQLVAARQAFMKDRDQFFALVLAGDISGAKAFLDGDLTRAYHDYDSASRDVFAFNAKVGEDRGAKVIFYANIAPIAIAGLSVLLFLLGVFFGLRSAYGGSIFISRFDKTSAPRRHQLAPKE